jgi:hypothetical protein
VKVLKRKILDELEVQGARYTLCLEYLSKKRIRAIIYHRSRHNRSDRLKNPAVWKQRPHKPKFIPYGYELWNSAECCAGRKALYQLAKSLVEGARTAFKIRGGWQTGWQELRGGDQFQDTISTWRTRCMGLLGQQLGERDQSQTLNDGT